MLRDGISEAEASRLRSIAVAASDLPSLEGLLMSIARRFSNGSSSNHLPQPRCAPSTSCPAWTLTTLSPGRCTPACRAPVAACPGGPSRPLCEGRKSTTKLPLTFRNGLKNGERIRLCACQIEASAGSKKPPRSQCSCGIARVPGWCPRRGLNPRPRDYETHPLPSNRAG